MRHVYFSLLPGDTSIVLCDGYFYVKYCSADLSCLLALVAPSLLHVDVKGSDLLIPLLRCLLLSHIDVENRSTIALLPLTSLEA